MVNSLFQKDRYIFSMRKIKPQQLNKELMISQSKLFRREIKNYGIKASDLYGDLPSIEKKNLILNIAKYVSEREGLISYVKRKKSLPIRDIGFETKVKEEFLTKWKSYIMAYIILFSDEKFYELVKYLRIEFRELDELSLVPVVNNSESNLIKGIAFKLVGSRLLNTKVLVLTNQGEFLRIVDNSEWQVGDESVGKEYKGIKKYYNKIAILTPIIIILLVIGNYIYSFKSTTVLIKGTSEIKLEVNNFNRVVSIYSPTEKGKKLVEDLRIKNKTVDKSLSEILIYLEKNKMIPENNEITLAITGKSLDFKKMNQTIELASGEIGKKYKFIVNNVGEEIDLKN
ncbi:MAG: anti-sigma-I factor RsgI family protein [Sarcina sp.]